MPFRHPLWGHFRAITQNGLHDPLYPILFDIQTEVVVSIGVQLNGQDLPGPVTALCVSGLPVDEFTYIGYLPHKKGEKIAFLKSKADNSSTLIIFSTPHRLIDDLQDIYSIFGNRSITVCRELTKLHEEIIRDNIFNTMQYFSEHTPLGEFVLVIAGKTDIPFWDDERIEKAIASGIAESIKSTTLATRISNESGIAKKEIYRRIEDYKKRK